MFNDAVFGECAVHSFSLPDSHESTAKIRECQRNAIDKCCHQIGFEVVEPRASCESHLVFELLSGLAGGILYIVHLKNQFSQQFAMTARPPSIFKKWEFIEVKNLS